MKTKSIVCDLAALRSVSDYSYAIAEKVKHLDISMVFLNAGVSTPGTFA